MLQFTSTEFLQMPIAPMVLPVTRSISVAAWAGSRSRLGGRVMFILTVGPGSWFECLLLNSARGER